MIGEKEIQGLNKLFFAKVFELEVDLKFYWTKMLDKFNNIFAGTYILYHS